MKKPKSKTVVKAPDPFFGLKLIGYSRTGLPLNEEDFDEEALVNFAKWQVCKVRNILWLDPIWDAYTSHEILIEYFAIRFDESEELRKEFEQTIMEPKKSDLAWFAAMEAKYRAEAGIIKGGNSSEAQPETTVDTTSPSEPLLEDPPELVPQDFEDDFR